MKTQFMTLWDGLTTSTTNRILIIGATNRPADVDSAILRRMPQMFYIGLPVILIFHQIFNTIYVESLFFLFEKKKECYSEKENFKCDLKR
jgi:ATP-dependent 26S proteasome regulatory subunit